MILKVEANRKFFRNRKETLQVALVSSRQIRIVADFFTKISHKFVLKKSRYTCLNRAGFHDGFSSGNCK
jgi:hypothetical protein